VTLSFRPLLTCEVDQTLTIDTCKLQFLYQGMDPTMRALPYNSLPWRLGLLTNTN
jgi:hypothetical protein